MYTMINDFISLAVKKGSDSWKACYFPLCKEIWTVHFVISSISTQPNKFPADLTSAYVTGAKDIFSDKCNELIYKP